MPISLEKLFQPRQVVPDLTAQNQDEALRAVAGVLTVNEAMLEPAKFLSELIARENLQSTAAGDGVAFPHARTDSVGEIVLGIGRSRAGVPFGRGGEIVHLIFVIGTPQRMVSDYLVWIGALARLLKNSDLREDLLRAGNATQLVEILQNAALPAG